MRGSIHTTTRLTARARARGLASVALASLLALAACGDDGTSAVGDTADATADAADAGDTDGPADTAPDTLDAAGDSADTAADTA
ncbi:MAG: hypothetical protein KC635_30285, partial [Myxococcales bacterium]|nr:hypothetical protein [Myxococcales bacterium]